MIVMKFGGSSVESREAINRVAAIVASARNQSPVVVVSAIGRTTTQLIEMAEMAARGYTSQYRDALFQLRARHLSIAPRLVHWQVKQLFDELTGVLAAVGRAQSLSPACWDAVASFGERLSSVVVTATLVLKGIPAVHLDARKVIVTDAHHTAAAPLNAETAARVRRAVARIAANRLVVLGGFIASTEDGVSTTLGRGGSDYTASLVGAALSVDEIQIWTDVDGMLSCDPRVLPGGRCLPVISYQEAGLMARFGAKVLHPETVTPAIRQRIPIVIRNSRNSSAQGTRIVADTGFPGGLVKCIACSGPRITLVGHGIIADPSLGTRVLSALRRRQIRWDIGETSSSVFSLTVPEAFVGDAVAALHAEFIEPAPASAQSGGLGSFSVSQEPAPLTLVGRR